MQAQGKKRGVASLCIGGGEAVALVVERRHERRSSRSASSAPGRWAAASRRSRRSRASRSCSSTRSASWPKEGARRSTPRSTSWCRRASSTPPTRASAIERIRIADGYAGFADCDLVVEAATENQELKKKIFQELDKAVKPGAILASNTSSISITLLGAQTKRPEKVIGMHFMNPVPVMKLVEVVRGLATDDDDLSGRAGAGQALRQDRW